MSQPDALVNLLDGLQSRQQDMLEMVGKFVTHLPCCAGTSLASIANRCAAAAQLVLGCRPSRIQLGTTITPTIAHVGSVQNTVPGEASLAIDVRAATVNERQRVDDALCEMQWSTGASIKVEGGIIQPALEKASLIAELCYKEAVHEA